MEKKRPIGYIFIISVYLIVCISGILNLFIQPNDEAYNPIVNLILTSYSLICLVGLILKRRWARLLSIILAVYLLALGIHSHMRAIENNQQLIFLHLILVISIPIFVLFYLVRPKARDIFMEDTTIERKRPIGILVLGSFFCFCSVFSFFLVFIALISGPPANSTFLNDTLPRIIFIISPILFISSTVGIFRLKAKSRILTLVLSVGIILFSIYGALDAFMASALDQFSIILFFIILTVFSSIIFYLTRPKVKEIFR